VVERGVSNVVGRREDLSGALEKKQVGVYECVCMCVLYACVVVCVLTCVWCVHLW